MGVDFEPVYAIRLKCDTSEDGFFEDKKSFVRYVYKMLEPHVETEFVYISKEDEHPSESIFEFRCAHGEKWRADHTNALSSPAWSLVLMSRPRVSEESVNALLEVFGDRAVDLGVETMVC